MKFKLLIFTIILAILLINTLHFFYQDEYDNILGGYFINQGRLPYTGFFTHHGPAGYFFASFITFFSGASFVKFRIILAFVYFIMFIAFYIFVKKKFGRFESNIILAFLFILSIASTYFWGHMLLSDSLAGYLIIPSYVILFLKIYNGKPFVYKDLIFISVLASLTILTSVTYLYAVAIIYIFAAYLFFKEKKFMFVKIKNYVIAIAAPYFIFLIYLIVTGSLQNFYYQNIFFNREYYVTMPDGSPIRNPVRYGIVIFVNFLDSYRALLLSIKDLNFGYPFNATLALSNAAAIIYMALNKKFNLAILIFGSLVYLTIRSNPLNSQETDYQAIPYNLISMFNGLFILAVLWTELKGKLEDNKRLIYSFLLLSLGIFYFYLNLFLLNKWLEKAYTKYMGTLPLIYDRPVIASTLNALLSEDDYYFIGPFDFREHLYMRSKLASKYFITIPAMDKSEKIKNEMLDDVKKNRPKIVVFNTDFQIFSNFPGKFLTQYLKEEYFSIEDLNKDEKRFQVLVESFGAYNEYDFSRHFFFDRQKKGEIIGQLIKQKLIKEIE